MAAEDRNYIRRRRVPRRVFERNVGLLVSGEYFVSRAHQISEGGMLVSCNRKLRPNQLVLVAFNIPGFVFAVTKAVVRYKRIPEPHFKEDRYGIQFEGLEFHAKRQIRNYVASKTREEFLRQKSGA